MSDERRETLQLSPYRPVYWMDTDGAWRVGQELWRFTSLLGRTFTIVQEATGVCVVGGEELPTYHGARGTKCESG